MAFEGTRAGYQSFLAAKQAGGNPLAQHLNFKSALKEARIAMAAKQLESERDRANKLQVANVQRQTSLEVQGMRNVAEQQKFAMGGGLTSAQRQKVESLKSGLRAGTFSMQTMFGEPITYEPENATQALSLIHRNNLDPALFTEELIKYDGFIIRQGNEESSGKRIGQTIDGRIIYLEPPFTEVNQ